MLAGKRLLDRALALAEPVDGGVEFVLCAPKEADVVDSIPPGYFGGNMDGKGATMYYPIAVPGGLFSIGDSHASQGDSRSQTSDIEKSWSRDLLGIYGFWP
jgi:acetamidase/formamidase